MARVYRKKENLLTRKIAGEALVIPIRGRLVDLQQIFALNPTAEFIWNAIDGTRTLADIGRSLEADFQADRAAVEADVEAFVADLLAAGLVEEC